VCEESYEGGHETYEPEHRLVPQVNRHIFEGDYAVLLKSA